MAVPPVSSFSSSRVASMYMRRQLSKDQVLRCHTPSLRLSLVRCPLTVAKGLERFTVKQKDVAALYARSMAASALMASMLKGEERVTLEFKPNWDGTAVPAPPISHIMTESLHVGEVRGFIHGEQVAHAEPIQGFTGKLLDDTAYPEGHLKVRKILYNQAKPITSITALQEGDITTDLRQHFMMSEQIPSVLHLEDNIQQKDSPEVAYVGGLLAQLLPGGEKRELEQIERSLTAGYMEKSHREGKHLWDIAKCICTSLSDADITDKSIFSKIPLDFYCRCSKSNFLTHLASFGQQELENMQTELPQTSLTCQFCNETYEVASKEYQLAKDVALGKTTPEELQQAEAAARLRTLNDPLRTG